MNREPYITAASALATAAREKRFGSVVLSSVSRGEGTSTSALEVVRALQHNFGVRSVLLEWNRLRPVYESWLDLDPTRTLVALRDGASVANVVQEASDGVHVLPFGRPSLELAVNGFHPVLCRTIRELEQSFQMVVIDTPPLMDSGDALAAVGLVRQLILVVQSGKTSYDQLNRIRQRLEADGVNIAGAILTQRKRALPRWMERIVGSAD